MSHDCDDNHPTPLTRFSDLSGNDPLEVTLAWAGLKRMFVNMAPKFVAKDAMPLISGGRFGITVSAKGSFRHDGNVLSIRVLVVDVDDWPFEVEDAMERLRIAGVAAILFTTPSHMVVKGNGIAGARFRLVLPLSTPTDHAGMTVAMNRVNELLDGHVAPESWKPAQSYYCGRLLHGPWFTDSCEGAFIDQATHIRERASSQPIPVKAFVHQAVNAGAPAAAPAGAQAGFAFPTAPAAAPAAGRGRPNKATSAMVGRLRTKGLFLGLQIDGTVWMKCPFGHLHSTKDTPGDCVWFPPHTMGYTRGHFKCMHSNHGGRTLVDQDFLDALDIPPATPANQGSKKLHDFIAVRPTGKFLHLPTMTEWGRTEVDAHVPRGEWPMGADGNQIPPSHWLATTDGQPAITQFAWLPGQATPIIYDTLTREGQLIPYQDSNILNLWRPIELPPLRNGIFDAEPWIDHWKTIYPDGWLHAVRMLAFAMQFPGIKINHGLALTGPTRIGKDSGLKPLAKWLSLSGNWKETTPAMMLGSFNDFGMTKFLRLNEIEAVIDTRGRATYVVMYDHLKIYFAAPPEMLPINRKGLAVLHVPNVLLLIITSNNVETVLNLIPEDQRAYVLSTNLRRDQMPADYHTKFHAWMDAGGSEAVIHYLMSLDVSDFDPSAPPPMTDAKRQAIQFAADPLEGVMADLLDAMGRPVVVDVAELARQAAVHRITFDDLPINAPKFRMRFSGWLRAAGYVRVTNPATTTGHFIVKGKRTAVFVREDQLHTAPGCITLHYGL
jgi:hypothetical protein